MIILARFSVALLVVVAIMFGVPGLSSAATPTVNLGAAEGFAVLSGQAVTNVPNSVITGNVGLSPAAGTNYAGLTTSEVSGTIYAVDTTGPAGAAGNNPSLVNMAKNDLTTAYLDAAGRITTFTFVAGDNQLGGQTLTDGVYAFGHASTANITAASPLTLDAQGNPNAVFIFQASSDLVTASNSIVRLVNGAQACRVFWQVTSSVTFGTRSTFVGNVLALTSITDDGYSTITGSLLARNGQVALNHTTINCLTCEATPTPTLTSGLSPSLTRTVMPSTGIHTGISAFGNSASLNIAILLAGIFTVAILFGVARRKG